MSDVPAETAALSAAAALPPAGELPPLPPPALTAGETLAPADPAQPMADALTAATALWRPVLAAGLAGQRAWLQSLQDLAALQQQHGREAADLVAGSADLPATPGALAALWGRALSLNLLQADALTRQLWSGWFDWERATMQEFEDLAVTRALTVRSTGTRPPA